MRRERRKRGGRKTRGGRRRKKMSPPPLHRFGFATAFGRTRHDGLEPRTCIKLYIHIFVNYRGKCRLKPERFIIESERLNRSKFGDLLLKSRTFLSDCCPHDGQMERSDLKSKFDRYTTPLLTRTESTIDSARAPRIYLCRVA
jgi:hypothetical protein